LERCQKEILKFLWPKFPLKGPGIKSPLKGPKRERKIFLKEGQMKGNLKT